ncbi:MAG: acyl-CoA synthetase [Rhodospirillales bacterium]|nr:acyl-CoA synthetase [Rhodospirillales bacterium]
MAKPPPPKGAPAAKGPPAKAPPAKGAPGAARGKAPPPPPPAGRKSKGMVTMILLVIGLPSIILFLPTWIFLGLAMLPTGVAFLVDRSKNRLAWISVAGMNLAGISYYLLNLWFGGHTVEHAVKMLANVFDLVVMYGSAAFGWILHKSLPPVVGAYLDVNAQHRLSALKATQRKLLAEWGPEITGKEPSEPKKETPRPAVPAGKK